MPMCAACSLVVAAAAAVVVVVWSLPTEQVSPPDSPAQRPPKGGGAERGIASSGAYFHLATHWRTRKRRLLPWRVEPLLKGEAEVDPPLCEAAPCASSRVGAHRP